MDVIVKSKLIYMFDQSGERIRSNRKCPFSDVFHILGLSGTFMILIIVYH